MSASSSSFTAGPYWVERVALCMLCFTMTSKTSETHQTTATMAATVRAMSAKIPATKVAVRRATMAVACWLGLKVESTNCIARVAYLSLRVDVQQIKCERVRSLPPTRLGPLSIQTGHLDINRHLGSPGTAETAHLPKLAPQFAVGAFQQRGGTHHFAHHPLQ